MFSLESPHRGDSNENTKYNIFNIKMKITLNFRPESAAMGFSQGLKNEFEIAVVKDPSMFEPLKFYCTLQTCMSTCRLTFTLTITCWVVSSICSYYKLTVYSVLSAAN